MLQHTTVGGLLLKVLLTYVLVKQIMKLNEFPSWHPPPQTKPI